MTFGSVIWLGTDLTLAFIPVALAFGVARGLRRDIVAPRRVRWELWLPLLAVWLLFLPNTCYLLTEWRHYLCDIHDQSVYYPIYSRGLYPPQATSSLLLLTLFYGVYTGLGLVAFFLALWPLHRLARPHWGRAAEPLRALICLLCSVGVYLGLVSRFNSWDFVGSRIAGLLATTTQIASHPALAALILLFGAGLWLLYTVFDIWMDGAALRLSRRHARQTNALPENALPEKDYPHASV